MPCRPLSVIISRLLAPALLMPAVLPVAALASSGADGDGSARDVELDRIVVVAAKIPQAESTVVNAVGRIERSELDRMQAQDIRDAFRYEPAVQVTADGHRFGAAGFNIRGLDGNRVAVEIDGTPIADAFRVGDMANAGRDAVDIEAIDHLEYLRGPASTLYGSDALAGVVAYTTADPFLRAARGASYSARLAWHERDDGVRGSASGAWAGEAHGMYALVTRRESSGLRNNAGGDGPSRNPADHRRDSGLFKYAWRGEGLAASLLAERSVLDSEVDVRSLVRGPGRFATTTALLAEDRAERDRVQLGIDGAPGAAVLDWRLRIHAQDSTTTQRSLQTIDAVPPRTPAYFRDRLFTIDQAARGAELTLHSRFDTGPLAHDLVYGVAVRRQSIEQWRDGTQTRLDTGETTRTVLGETLPVRDFPNSTTRQTALYLQDDVLLGDLPLSLVLGVRHEWHRLHAVADPVFAEDFDYTPAHASHRRTTPRLGLRWNATDALTAYVLYAEGFRTPPYSDVNIALALPMLDVEVRPNPALRPERSRGVELGLDWRGDATIVRAAAFDNRYRDLIESRANLGRDPLTGTTVFQSVNRDSARIRGVELAAEHHVAGWHARAALAAARGDDLERRQPLASVAPASAVFGIGRSGSGWTPSLELVATAVARRDRIDPTGPALFEAPGYTTVDLLADWQHARGWRLAAGIHNLADRRYWEWGQIQRQTVDAALPIAFFTAPGRNVAVTIEKRW